MDEIIIKDISPSITFANTFVDYIDTTVSNTSKMECFVGDFNITGNITVRLT